MKNRTYSIGFLIVSLMVLVLLSGAYELSYRAAVERAREEQTASVLPRQEEASESVETEGEAAKGERFFLMEKNGYVAVFLEDQTTVYEYTSIEVDALPETMQKEIRNGKLLESIEELYGFLENFSS